MYNYCYVFVQPYHYFYIVFLGYIFREGAIPIYDGQYTKTFQLSKGNCRKCQSWTKRIKGQIVNE